MTETNIFYTYAYLREDRTPYYIGKGKKDRIIKRTKKDVKPPKDKSRIIFLKKNLSEKDAFKHEIYMIAVFGRKNLGTGILLNKTNGGDGSSGTIVSDEVRKKLSAASSGKNNPAYGKKGKDHPSFGYRHTLETRKFLSEFQRGEKNHMYGKFGKDHPSYGSKRTIEQRKKLSASRRGEKNHRYGKKAWNHGKSLMMWVTNGIDSKLIYKTDSIPENWYRGRTFPKQIKRIRITNGTINKFIPIEEKIPPGWYRGLVRVNNK